MATQMKRELPTEAKLKIIIVGAGLGGAGAAISCLLKGHSVHILESASEIGEIGAGIQVLPNSSKVLKYWGLEHSLLTHASHPKAANLINWKGIPLSSLDFGSSTAKYPGTCYWDFHRADLHRVLIERAVELGASMECNARVVDVKCKEEGATVLLADGREMEADLVVGADGIHSRMREVLVQRKQPPKRTGDLAYRLLLDAEKLKEDPELAPFVLNKEVNYWIGPGAHVVTYMLRDSSLCNMVLLVPDDMPEDGPSTIAGNVEEMRSLFTGWDPRITKLLALCENVQRWRLCIVEPLETWYHPSGSFVLLGDSVHATLPYLASGAGMSFEDAAVLGECLGKVKSKSVDEKIFALKVYQACRKERTEMIVERGNVQQVLYHLDDGDEQVERDRKIRANGAAQTDADMEEGEALVWRDPVLAPKLLGYDHLQDVEKHWNSLARGRSVAGSKL
ncbi:FAD/NAD(P)-binding domain-containing protein [Mollisia scopiformis]|uniref:FAD/NAD(P)-binding domain-containing protein n=1 Tax=Mollisia scopiformis TaxID=149040 RepID=A0A194XV17_MOLSC|nr:FAD/NAD(P)-binding domain-containing protein [Mollisia scopiformis]KUJ23552.1 FAD/NAD(P)-binding domain-containing protein [Mollisia scopiformis]